MRVMMMRYIRMFVLITTVTAVYSFQSSPKLFKTTTGRRRQFINVYPSIPTASNHYQLTPAAKAKPRIKHAISSTKFFVHPFNDIKNPSTSTLSTAFIGHALPVAKVSRCYQQLLGRTMSWLPSTKKWAINIQNARRTVASIVLAFVLVFGATWTPAWAVSGGRVGGGSFKSSPSRSSSSRSGSYGGTSTLSRPSYGGRAPMILRSPVYNYGVQQRTPPIIINHFGNRWYAPTHESALIHTRASAKDIIVLTGAGALLAYSMRNNYNRRTNQGDSSNNGPLGFGYTVGSLTVAMDVPDRSDPTNILTKLSRVATATDTNSRKGVQDLLSDVALELLRQEKAVTSAAAQFKSYPISGQAEREFQIQSVQSQSKVDRLTVNKFGSQDKSIVSSNKGSSTAPTVAIVTINYAIEGDATKLPSTIRTRDDLRRALSRIAADAKVGDCLQSAEILWAPEDPTETLTRETAYADFPNLLPI